MELLDVGLDNGYRLLILALPALLGALIGRLGLLGDNERAVSVLNVYALYIGFPALVFVGLLDRAFELPSSPWFWLVVPVAHSLVVGLVWLTRSSHRGTLALVGLFGNVAYLGLPLVIGLYGADSTGAASLIVGIHVAISVSVGPFLLRRWSTDDSAFEWSTVLKQPLLWAPVAGLLARFLPPSATAHLETAASPIAGSAAPVALFLLGLYIWIRRDALFGPISGAITHVAVRLALVPACTAAVCYLAMELGDLESSHARLFIVLSGMPAAITTFSIAHDAGTGSDVIAATIVRTTVVAAIYIPILATLVSVGL